MKQDVLRFGAIAAVLSVITTIGIHSFFKGPASFEEGLQIYKSANYIAGKWWVILHCIIVLTTVFAVSQSPEMKDVPLIRLAVIFYGGFALFEITRMTLVLNYFSTLRDQYLAADESMRPVIRVSLDSFSGISGALFAAFSICFCLGNFFLGFSFLRAGSHAVLSVMFLLWSAMTVIYLTNDYVRNEWLETFFGYFNLVYQPIARFALAWYLFVQLRKVQKPAVTSFQFGA